VAQGTDNGVIIMDAEGRTEWVNAAFTRHTGYALPEILGQKFGALLHGPDTDPVIVQRIRERMKRRKPFSVTILNYKKSGQKVWFGMDITPIYNDNDELTQFVALLQNINYRKEIEASQAKMTQDLYRHNRDLQQFTYVISHNLRGPLSNALGLAKMLTKVDKTSTVFDTALANLRQSIDQADEVLKDLNLVLSIRDRQDVLEQETVTLADVCAQAVSHLNEALQQCGGQVTLDVAEGLAIHGNRAYLYSIFYNLLSNSIKYRCDDRPLLVTIECAVGTHSGPTIIFTDNGSGFDTFKAGSDVFQLYKRFHTNQRGRGIGLFLVKTHVEAMGGKIEVSSEVNVGTQFRIHLDS
jgi:PAS domain S-box-containing protein